jgi:signal transduction histidine kinase
MKSRTQSNFPAFELTIVVALILIGWAALTLYELGPEVKESRESLLQLRDQYFLLSEGIRTNIDELDDALTAFLDTKNGAEVARFQKQSAQWEQWFARTRRTWQENGLFEVGATNETLKGEADLAALLLKVETVYTNYVRAARYLMAQAGRPLIQERYSLREQSAQRSRQHLLNLSRKARANGEAFDLVLSGSEEQMGTLVKRIRDLRLGFLLGIVGLAFLLMLLFYRRKVSQADAIIQENTRHRLEQQVTLDKLTHFGQLAQELAHEIKQPLTAMNARAYTLQKILAPGTDAQKDATVIRSEIKRLDQIVKDFLELARPAEPPLVAVQADHALAEVRDIMAPVLAQSGIDFRYECEEDLDFSADLQQLKQVLINLVKNAAESVKTQGMVSLRGYRQTRPLKGELTEAAIIEVGDTGPGIPADIQGKIFDPFFSTKADGTGLGLAIAARIVDKHGGNLEFDTEVGKGTIFRIVLPASRKEQPA